MISKFVRVIRPKAVLSVAGIVSILWGAMSPGLFAAEGEPTSSVKVARALELIRQVGPEAKGYEEARSAVNQLYSSSEVTVFDVLAAMREASPLAKNWLRSVASQVADRTAPKESDLLAFLSDRANDADARYLVYRWIVAKHPEQEESLLDAATDDPSLGLRYLAIARLLKQAKEATETTDANDPQPEAAKELLGRVLVDGRNPEQLRAAVDAFKDLGVEVDLSKELGMFANWYVLGPFSNVDGVGYGEAYDVEQALVDDGAQAFSVGSEFSGKSQTVTWKPASTDDSMGSLDLNPSFDNEKEAVSYAFCKFTAENGGPADARLGSIGANKVWVNGQLVIANEVYHAGSMVDQYIGKCDLRPGENWVLLKLCQNNQTESWAQDWQFQFRITDETGKPLNVDITTPAAAR